MLMSLPELVATYGIEFHGVLHCGAHLAEEAPIYDELGAGPVTWIEANPRVFDKIRAALEPYPDQRLVEALVYDQDHVTVDFNVTNYDGMSSSILKFGTHPEFSPDTVFVETVKLDAWKIDTLVARHNISANFLNMDLQGAELHALRGAMKFLEGVQYVMSEVNKAEVYRGCAKVGQLDELLGEYGLKRVETYWVPNQGWGDALWIRA